MLGGYVSDLEAGDVFKPVEYVLTAFMCSEYAHGVETNYEPLHSASAKGERQVRPPTMIHVDKIAHPRGEPPEGAARERRRAAVW